jgi:integrase
MKQIRPMGFKYRYLTYISGKAHYQRRFPTDLVDLGIITSKNFKRSLKSSPDDVNSIVSEINQINDNFEKYVRLLRNQNPDAETQQTIDQLAVALLEVNKLAPGLLAKVSNPEDAMQSIEHTGIFDDLYDLHQEAQYKREKAQYDGVKLLAQKRAREILFDSTFQPATTLSTVKAFWISKKNLSEEVRNHRRQLSIWDCFVEYGGGDAIMDEELIEEYLHQFVQQKRVNKPDIKSSSLERQITTITSAIKLYCNEHRLKLDFQKPKLAKDKVIKRAKSLVHDQQIIVVKHFHETHDWIELFILIAFHCGWHSSEARQALKEDFIFDSEVPRLFVSGELSESRKDKDRGRIVPLVYRVQRIEELVNNGALEEMQKKAADNISSQVRKFFQSLNIDASMYSLRHTLAHNVEAAGVNESDKAKLGGWAGKGFSLSEHMARYGKDGADTTERLKPLQTTLNKVLSHLP